MIKIRVLVLLFLTSIISGNVFSQEKEFSEKDIKVWLSNSGKHFLNLESDKSLQFANKALEYSIKLNENELAAKSYNLIGLNFADFSDKKKAIEYYKKGLDYANKTSNDTIKCWLSNNIANLYSYNKIDFKESIKYYKIGLKYSIKLKDDYEITFTKLNMVTAYFSMGDYQNGIVYLNEAKKYVDTKGDVEAKITLNALYADYYNQLNQDEKAEYYYLKSLEYCFQNEVEFINSHVSNTYKDISNFYFKKKDFVKAYDFLRKHDSLQDLIYNDERTKEVGLASQDIEKNESKRKIEQIEAEKVIQDERIFQTKVVIFLFFIIFTILFILLFSLIKNNKRRLNSNLKLQLANEELVIAKEKAEEASNIKTQFISNISHELRTPLYGVIGITDIIEEEHKELRGSQHLKSLKFSAKYLLALVNDILKVYKIEEQKIVLESVLFNLEDELETIIDSLRIIAISNNNKMVFEIDKSIPEFLYGDKIRLSQILINLLSNSLKFTNNGTVKVIAKAEDINGSNLKLVLKVIDDGIGIPVEYQEAVFDKFVQIERREDDYQGTGLGLTIVKKLVNLFQGSVKLESEEGFGTTFIVELPFESGVDKLIETINSTEVDLSDYSNYRILIVEDNKINQVVTKRLLENHKFICTIVDDGFKAIDVLKHEEFDAILMDINMPKINGFETTKIIRSNGIRIPIIAVTAFDRQEIEEKMIEADINDVIVKPFEPAKLFQMIYKLINEKTL
ncbi:ATP-binding protein [Flavobacterium sp.]|jgi:signal transduction histidine kinase|uniref:ATP-binding response regulator n=1 Tax=Flavobacterium sp. TaxID=239 RepID=UPI002A83848B|nr:ATP-binding protein [Flavobacterium sp.]